MNTIALGSAFLGTVLVFVLGLPPGVLREGQYVADQDTPGKRAYKIASYIGLALIGFLLQLVAI